VPTPGTACTRPSSRSAASTLEAVATATPKFRVISRADGTRSFLESRGIHLPEGTPDDPADAETINGLSNRKNEILLERLRNNGIQVYPGSVKYLHAVKDAGLHRAVVSASANTRQALDAAHLTDQFEAIVDGIVAGREHLKGKPAPDSYLAAARLLHVQPFEAVVFEDALAGVAAGRAGGFGFVVGVDRVGQRKALQEHGACQLPGVHQGLQCGVDGRSRAHGDSIK